MPIYKEKEFLSFGIEITEIRKTHSFGYFLATKWNRNSLFISMK